MEKHALKPEGVAVPAYPYSSAVVSGDWLLLAGQVPFDEHGTLVSEDFTVQARRVFDNVGACLRAGGCDFGHVVKVTAYLADFGDFQVFNEVYREYFEEPYPVRTTIPAPLVGLAIEVDVMARIDTGAS